MSLFNHVQIKVSNLEQSKKLYDALMQALEYSVVLDIPHEVRGYGISTNNMFEIRQATPDCPISQHVHIAFNALCPEAVQNFYHTALSLGARCNGNPGLRSRYAPNYYAAFIIDYDGNNIEVVSIL